MFVRDLRGFKKEDLFHCFSENLYAFIRYSDEVENVIPISFYIHNKTGKGCYVFVKGPKLQKALDKWQENKEKGGADY